MINRVQLIFVLLLICGKPFTTNAQQQVHIPTLNNAVTIDGVFVEQEWQNAGSTSLDYVTSPDENAPAPVQTQVYYFSSLDTLYVAFIAHDNEPEKMRALFRDRDRNFSDDSVSIKLDPYNDGRLAYQFFVNPLGVQADLVENEMTQSGNESWNGIWESAGKLTDSGYVVEIAIPLRLMNFVEGPEEKTWGVEFVRFYPREDYYRISHVTVDRNNACTLCQMGKIIGFKDAKQGENLALVPTLVLGGLRTRDVESNIDWESQTNQEVGLDVNWGISPELTFSGTLNPDFSQVESDVAQVTINRTFALFFPEQRPFFVENAEYFSSPQNLVYTRNINAPDYGAKISGRLDSHSIGAFVANDDSTSFIIPGNLGSSVARLEEKSVNVAARYRYDYSDTFSFGILSTLRNSDSYYNQIISADIRYLISPQDTLRVQYVHSETEYPEFLFQDFCGNDCRSFSDINEQTLRAAQQDKFKGYSYRVLYDRDTRDYFLRARRTFDDAGYRADLGFANAVDRQRWIFGGGYRWWNENSWWNRIQISGDWDITHNSKGEFIERESEAELGINALLQSFFRFKYERRSRVGLRQGNPFPADDIDLLNINEEGLTRLLSIDGLSDIFEERSISFYTEMKPNGIIEFSSSVQAGNRIDFANNRLGEQFRTQNGFRLNLGRHFQWNLDYTFSALDADSQKVFNAKVLDTRLTYQFDPFQFVRVIATYSDVTRNPENYLFDTVDERSRDLNFQLLYSYKLNPLTKFFVGYSQSGTGNERLRGIQTNSQALFMKFSYAWLP